ncbi:MAG TPA: hypothetical protein VFN54_05690 [Acidimicrobiales bacterium]|nr:hypothetical protein [Acidimicrobiales bacterium]
MSPRRATGASGSSPGVDPLVRLGAVDPLARLGRLSWRRPVRAARNSAVVAVSLVAILVGLAVTVALVAGIASGVVGLTRSRTPSAPAVRGHVTEVMKILTTGNLPGTGNQPQFTNPQWTVHVNERVTVKIVNFDDGTAPLMGAQMMYDKVVGSSTGQELVAGQALSSIPDTNVAHTFTIVGLPFNMPIPAAPTGKSVTVVASFVPTKTGTFTWQCYAPCGAGTNGMGGAMSTMKWMEGKIKVIA